MTTQFKCINIFSGNNNIKLIANDLVSNSTTNPFSPTTIGLSFNNDFDIYIQNISHLYNLKYNIQSSVSQEFTKSDGSNVSVVIPDMSKKAVVVIGRIFIIAEDSGKLELINTSGFKGAILKEQYETVFKSYQTIATQITGGSADNIFPTVLDVNNQRSTIVGENAFTNNFLLSSPLLENLIDVCLKIIILQFPAISSGINELDSYSALNRINWTLNYFTNQHELDNFQRTVDFRDINSIFSSQNDNVQMFGTLDTQLMNYFKVGTDGNYALCPTPYDLLNNAYFINGKILIPFPENFNGVNSAPSGTPGQTVVVAPKCDQMPAIKNFYRHEILNRIYLQEIIPYSLYSNLYSQLVNIDTVPSSLNNPIVLSNYVRPWNVYDSVITNLSLSLYKWYVALLCVIPIMFVVQLACLIVKLKSNKIRLTLCIILIIFIATAMFGVINQFTILNNEITKIKSNTDLYFTTLTEEDFKDRMAGSYSGLVIGGFQLIAVLAFLFTANVRYFLYITPQGWFYYLVSWLFTTYLPGTYIPLG